MSKLVDSYNRPIDYLRISVTDRCNLRCIYCMPADGIPLTDSDNILRYEELLRIANVAVRHGITKIRLTGGEPLVRKGIVGFIEELAKLKGVEDLSLTTNGVLLKEFASSLKRGGLKRVNVSLDSLKCDRFHKITRGDLLSQVLEGIEEAERIGLSPVKINCVVIRGFNDDEILDFALLTKTKSFHIRFIEYMPFEAEEAWQRDKYISASELMKTINSFQELVPLGNPEKRTGPAKRYSFKDGIGEIGLISPVSDHFCSACNRLRLTADGKLRTCLFSDDEIDIKTALRNGCTDKELEDLLFNAVRKKPEKHHISENIFKKCSRTMSFIGG
ncbi:MAG: GTP 3',8-cyclase MoaA [Deltaproteobacteria bacterium]|nr:GTP 3',8-cyclase MoaA [Deltaproteobacteria bacterium]